MAKAEINQVSKIPTFYIVLSMGKKDVYRATINERSAVGFYNQLHNISQAHEGNMHAGGTWYFPDSFYPSMKELLDALAVNGGRG